jgi:hypothetical protein
VKGTSMITRDFLVFTFWMGVFIITCLLASPVILYMALRHEKHHINKFVYISIVIIFDICLITWFLYYLHQAKTTLPTLIMFYFEYFKTSPNFLRR